MDYDRRLKDIRSERVDSDTTVGTLIIYEAGRDDSGNYTCSPSNLDSASVLLHVLNGKSIIINAYNDCYKHLKLVLLNKSFRYTSIGGIELLQSTEHIIH